MIDRHLLGDVGLAVLLAVPTVALASPAASLSNARSHPAATQVRASSAVQGTPLQQRLTLRG
jgi:hypothetical protein